MEYWQLIPSNRDYGVSNKGRVMRVKTGKNTTPGKILKRQVKRTGYIQVGLYKNKKTKWRTVHSLVLEAFVGPPNGSVCNHKDFDKSNNNLSNLEYVTREENERHALENERHALENGHKQNSLETRKQLSSDSPSRKITEIDALQIRDFAKKGMYQREIGELYGLSQTHVGRIISGKRWGWL